MKRSMKIKIAILIGLTVAAALFVCSSLGLFAGAEGNVFGGDKMLTFPIDDNVRQLMETSNHYIVVKQRQMGGSHYAYTEAVAETNAGVDLYGEINFNPGAQLIALSVLDNGDGTASTYEKILLNLTTGVVRDPSVSFDGTRVIYAKKNNNTDDYHIYEMELTSGEFKETQLTFGNGRADIEPQYLANGNIIFSSTRDVQTVDCWYTPVSNLFIMDGNGDHIRRVGYDQVHTTFPTVTSDGRVLYTRWDYNDRTQMFIQGVFQMFQDGTYQVEVWGNDADYPTTLLHTRDIPGAPGKYVSIASGHHVPQKGKLVTVDTTAGRNDPSAIKFLFPDSTTGVRYNTDHFGQDGRAYKYPYALNENLFLVSATDSYTGVNASFNIYLCNKNESFSKATVICQGAARLPAAQIVPIKMTKGFDRVSTVDYAQSSGIYYVANVYEGDSLKNVEKGSVKYLRVVSLEFRSSASGATVAAGGSAGGTADVFSPVSIGNGSWDVKNVLGIVPVEEDGSALFRVPSETPVYFQLLDGSGFMIQTMRSWSTLMPGETFSCVGCHEDKNSVPRSGGGITMAMKKGVQDLQRDLWMDTCADYENFDPYERDYIGFSYPDVIQPILDQNCVVCHSDTDRALARINAAKGGTDTAVAQLGYLIPYASVWTYSVDGGAEQLAHAPFGDPATGETDVNTKWTAGTLTMKKSFLFTTNNKDACDTALLLKFAGSVTVKVNGATVFTGSSSTVTTKTVKLEKTVTDRFTGGMNEIQITVSGGRRYIECALRSAVDTGKSEIIPKASTWKYQTASSDNLPNDWISEDYDDSSWKTGKAPFGDRGDITKMNTGWSGSQSYIWLRSQFDLTAEQIERFKGGYASLSILYDDTIKIYINGQLVFNPSKLYVDAYTACDISAKPESFLKAGSNTIAVSLHNTGGGRAIDFALYVTPNVQRPSTEAKISLSGEPIFSDGNRMMREYPLSYLVLTDAYPSGSNWVGSPSGAYVKWISTMSGANALSANYSGSSLSPLISKLKKGHGGLTDAQIRAIACWIDLAVPCYGSYSDGERFAEDTQRACEERVNKRHFYDTWDRYVKMDLGGTLPEGTVEVRFKSGDGKTELSASGNGYAILNGVSRYTAGDKITVKVTGSKYAALSVNERQGESILYLPDGEFTYTVPSNLAYTSNATFRTSGAGYRENTIFVRIPTAEELKKERVISVNPYDASSASNAFPHASGSCETNTSGVTEARNAIDGFTANRSTGKWPYQSYVPTDGATLKIDFGRKVKVGTLTVKMRAADGDTHLMSAIVTFSDGSKQTLDLWDTDKEMTFDLGGKTVTYLTLGSFEKAAEGKFAFTEVSVSGCEA
ncbi:MAG: hypothetical protein IJU52_00525 [Clostridia bacterium]|nr:hypothetical protein [Clostridia bacterium]